MSLDSEQNKLLKRKIKIILRYFKQHKKLNQYYLLNKKNHLIKEHKKIINELKFNLYFKNKECELLKNELQYKNINYNNKYIINLLERCKQKPQTLNEYQKIINKIKFILDTKPSIIYKSVDDNSFNNIIEDINKLTINI